MLHIFQRFKDRRNYVIADCSDNSITFSKALFNNMKRLGAERKKITVFSTHLADNRKTYAMILVDPDGEPHTQKADIMYNAKYKCVGFECLVPTVNAIFYEFGLLPGKAKFTVRKKITAGEVPITYYEICRPY